MGGILYPLRPPLLEWDGRSRRKLALGIGLASGRDRGNGLREVDTGLLFSGHRRTFGLLAFSRGSDTIAWADEDMKITGAG